MHTPVGRLFTEVGIVGAAQEIAAKAVVDGMTLHQSNREASQPTQIVGQGSLASTAVVFAESHVQGPVHRLDAPVFSYRFGETFATQVTTANIVTDLTCLAAIGVLGQANGIADRLHPRPLFGAHEIAWHLGEIVSPFVESAVPVVARLVMAIAQVFEVAVDLLAEERGDGVFERRLIVFGGHDKVAAAVDDLFADVLLTAHGVDRDEGVRKLDLLEQERNGGDFVGLFRGGDLAQSDAFLAGPGADDVQGAESIAGIMRAAATFAVNGNEAIGLGVVGGDGVGDPVLKATLEGLGLEGDEQSANAIA